jgi:hypothetical protein
VVLVIDPPGEPFCLPRGGNPYVFRNGDGYGDGYSGLDGDGNSQPHSYRYEELCKGIS